ncbi:MAG TPA: AP2 domain-containing protein [Polyangia bacterium]|nr:AP2 domain-containing protein [Polyangia bacterium]
MGTPKGLRTDHRNHNPLDNRRGNLRIATPSQNNQNARISSINSSGFKGVWYDKRCKRWATAIKLGGKRFFLGRYKTSELASEKYKEAAIRMFGEFACAGDGSPFPEVPACNPGERKGEIGS